MTNNFTLSIVDRRSGFACANITQLTRINLVDALLYCKDKMDCYMSSIGFDNLRKECSNNPKLIIDWYTYRLGAFPSKILDKVKDEESTDEELFSEIKKAVKNKLPEVYPFISSDNVFRGLRSNICTGCSTLIIDLDHHQPFHLIKEDYAKFCTLVPNCIAVWSSFSGKCHLAFQIDEVILSDEMIEDGFDKITLAECAGVHYIEQFRTAYECTMCNLIDVFRSEYNLDLLELPKCVDLANAKCYQGIGLNYLAPDDLYINDNVSAYNLPLTKYNDYKSRYSSLINEKVDKKKSVVINLGIFKNKSVDLTQEKIKIDKDTYIGEVSGNTARNGIAGGLLYLTGGNAEIAIETVKSRFEEKTANEIIAWINTLKNRQVDAPGRKMMDFCSELLGVDESFDEELTLADGEYLSKYRDVILSRVKFGRPVYLKSGCGTGKSVFFKSLLVDDGVKVCIVSHLKSIRDSVYAGYEKYILTTAKAAEMLNNHEYTAILGQFNKLICVWDTYKLLIEDEVMNGLISGYLKCFDECHNLVNSWGYRSDAISSIVNNLTHNSIYCTATPLGEEQLIPDLYKIEVVKGLQKKIVYHLVEPKYGSDAELTEIIKHMDTVGTVTSLIESIRLCGYSHFTIYDNVNHYAYKEYYQDFAMHFSRVEKNQSEIERAAREEFQMMDEYKELRETDLLLLKNTLGKFIWITTTAGIEGIEIKNEVDRVAVIVVLNGATCGDVEQLLNRWRCVKNIDVFLVMDGSSFVRENDNDFYNTLSSRLIDSALKSRVEEDLRNENWLIKHNMYIDNTKLTDANCAMISKFCIAYHNMRVRDTLRMDNVKYKYKDLVKYPFRYSVTGTTSKGNIRVAYDIKDMTNNYVYLCGLHEVTDEYGQVIYNEDGRPDKWGFVYVDDAEDKIAEINITSKRRIKTIMDNVLARNVNNDEVKYLSDVLDALKRLYESCIPVVWKCVESNEVKGKHSEFVKNIEYTSWNSECERLASSIVKMFTYCVADNEGNVVSREIKWELMRTWLNRRESLIRHKMTGTWLTGTDVEKKQDAVNSVWSKRGFDFVDSFDCCLFDLRKMFFEWDSKVDYVGHKGYIGGYKRDRSKYKFCLVDDETVKFVKTNDAFRYLLASGVVKENEEKWFHKKRQWSKFLKKI